MKKNSDINSNYTKFYGERVHNNVYPTEFVVRTFLATYPNLNMKKPQKGSRILDVAFGDGRNTAFLCDLGLEVSGIEITSEIVEQTKSRLTSFGHNTDLRVGRNNQIPFDDGEFDYILACHCCYYCDEGETILDNMKEYARVLKQGGILIASIADINSYIFNDAETIDDGTRRIKNDPYGNRNDYRLHCFSSIADIEVSLSTYFKDFSFGHASNDYYGVHEKVFWVVCVKK